MEQTPIPTHLAQSRQTLKGQEKKKAEAVGSGTTPVEEGRTEASEPTCHSGIYAHLGTQTKVVRFSSKGQWSVR